MTLSLLPFLERIWPGSQKDQDADWFARGVAAHEKRRYLKALDAWRRSSAQGHLESYYRIGLLYARGEGVFQSLPDAAIWYKRAAEAGQLDVQHEPIALRPLLEEVVEDAEENSGRPHHEVLRRG